MNTIGKNLMSTPIPIVVDLDGTLIHTDMLHESVLKVLGSSPINLLRVPYWLIQGKAVLKKRLADLVDFDPSLLPYNQELLEWLKARKAEGHKLILCTASDGGIAAALSEHLGIFDEVMASDGLINMVSNRKANALRDRFGSNGFDYAGNSNADLPVWKVARKAIIVNASLSLTKKAENECRVDRTFPAKNQSLKIWIRGLRVHQWLKNLLLFIPLFAAHQLNQVNTWLDLILAFFSFSLCASSVYIANDLLDLESDRRHPRKRLRPFAAGLIPLWLGVLVAPILLVSSFVLAKFVAGNFLPWLIFYFILTCAYSWGLKRFIVVDCLILAMLYTLRIIAGAAAASMDLSFWLLAFGVFLFLSLAFVKRYAELEIQLLGGKEKVSGRGYYTSDASLVQTLGVASGFASVLVLALYLNSDSVVKLYRTPELVWGAVPIMMFWVSWMWMQAHRGNMHDDPLVFALKDKASLFAGFLFGVVLLVGTLGWPW